MCVSVCVMFERFMAKDFYFHLSPRKNFFLDKTQRMGKRKKNLPINQCEEEEKKEWQNEIFDFFNRTIVQCNLDDDDNDDKKNG